MSATPPTPPPTPDDGHSPAGRPPRDRPAPSPHAQPLGGFRSPGRDDRSAAPTPSQPRPEQQPPGSSLPRTDDDAPRHFRPSRLATASSAVLWVALLVSAALHTGAIVAAADRTFGFVDAGAFESPDRAVRVKRARFDVILPAGGRAAGPGGDQMEATSGDNPADADELLDDLLAPDTDATTPPSAQLDLRPVDERRPADAAAELAIALPGFEIDPALLDTLVAAAPDEAAFVEGTGLAGRGDGTDPTDQTAGGDLTAALLAASVGSSARSPAPGSAGATGGNARAGGSGIGQPGAAALDRRPATNLAAGLDDRRPAAAPPPGPNIDFAALALAETTGLIFPEHLDDDFVYTLTVTRDLTRPDESAYFRIEIEPRRSLRKLATLPKDIVFLVDTSSSIPQDWVDEIVLGVEQSLVGLNADDRFNLVVFSDTVRIFRSETVAPTPDVLGQARAFLRDAKSKGYTDVNAALRRLLRRDLAPGRVYTLVLISDGKPTVGVVDARQLINLITRENDRVAGIYCIGAAPQKQLDPRLLDFLAYRNNGYSTLVTEKENVAATVRDLASTLRYPLITDVQVRVAGTHASEVYPRYLPTIHQGQAFSVYGRYHAAEPMTVQITGRAQDGRPVDFTFTRDPADAEDAGLKVARGWAFWKLHEVYSELLRLGERPELVEEVRQLRRRYDLETLY